MLYIARELHMPNGEMLRNMVIEIADGCVNNIYPFADEAQSMQLVDDVFLASSLILDSELNIKRIPHLEKGERMYAYVKSVTGEPILLE